MIQFNERGPSKYRFVNEPIENVDKSDEWKKNQTCFASPYAKKMWRDSQAFKLFSS